MPWKILSGIFTSAISNQLSDNCQLMNNIHIKYWKPGAEKSKSLCTGNKERQKQTMNPKSVNA